jgi:hypothetical protein
MYAHVLNDHASELWGAVADLDDPLAAARIIMVANALENMAAHMAKGTPQPIGRESFVVDDECPSCAA